MQRQRRLLTTAILAGFGLASFRTADAQPQPFQEDPPRYRSNRPYESERDRDADRDVERREEVVGEETAPPERPVKSRDVTDGARDVRRREAAVEWRGVTFHSTAAAGGRPGTSTAVAASQDLAEQPGDAPAIGLRGGIDLPSQYHFRGYMLTGGGWTVQPYATLAWTAYRNENVAVTPFVGTWISWGEEQGPRGPHHFQEFDLIGGVGVDLGDVDLAFQYVYYRSPAFLFDDSYEVGVDATYDDSRMWRGGPIEGLYPSVAVFYQTRDDNDDDYNTYVGLGLEPALRDFEVGGAPVNVSFPLTFGGSYDGYYKDDFGHNAEAGFWSVGLKAGLPLGRGSYGIRWAVEAEVDYVRFLADSAENANEGDPDDIIFRLGFRIR